MYVQQGDLILEDDIEASPGEYTPVRIPKTAKRKKTDVLAEGEATGHAHRLAGSATLLTDGSNTYVRKTTQAQDVTVKHEEHHTLPAEIIGRLQKDIRVRRVVEYDHFQEEAREIRD